MCGIINDNTGHTRKTPNAHLAVELLHCAQTRLQYVIAQHLADRGETHGDLFVEIVDARNIYHRKQGKWIEKHDDELTVVSHMAYEAWAINLTRATTKLVIGNNVTLAPVADYFFWSVGY